MLSEWEFWACANRVLQSHGENASLHAAGQIEALAQAGDADGCAHGGRSPDASHSSERMVRHQSIDPIRRERNPARFRSRTAW
jgi:hypothetical protein